MGLLEKISARTVDRPSETRYAADQWINEYLIPSQFQYNGAAYPIYGSGLTQTLAGNRATEIAATLPGYLAALRMCPPAFAAQLVRALVLSQARFVFRNPPWHPSTPRRTFGTRSLQVLEQPWKNATTGELIGRMEWHAGLAGNAYVARRPNRLRVLRPDWTAILYGSDLEPDDPGHALDGELLGYIYCNQGLFNGMYKPHTLLPADVAHWSPIPDPENAGVGMSWITPAIREIQQDRLATQHTIRYFEQGATPNLVVKGIQAATPEQFKEIVDQIEEGHAGVWNAYKTLYLTAGADATPVGANLGDLDLKNVHGGSETRIASLSRVHPVILAIAEGLAGSSLNAGNFGMARRIWADTWIYPTLQDLAGSLAPLVDVPADAELWTDTGDMPILREDAKDAAEINQIKMATIVSGVNGGWEPESVKAYADSGDVKLLKHTGLLSVQLQPPGAEMPAAGAPDPKGPAGSARRQIEGRKFNPAEPRDPHSGKWVGTGGTVRDVLKLADRIDLKPGETFVGSDTINAEDGRINLAWIKRGGGTHLRFAAGQGAFAEDAHKWRAANRGHTVELDADGTRVLHSELTRMAERAKQAGAEMRQLNKQFDHFYAKHGEHPLDRAASEKWLKALPPDAAAEYKALQDRADAYTDGPAAHSAVHGSWGTVRSEVEMHDLQNPSDWSLVIGAQPMGAPDDWDLHDGAHGTWLSRGQVKKLQGMLAQHSEVHATAGTS